MTERWPSTMNEGMSGMHLGQKVGQWSDHGEHNRSEQGDGTFSKCGRRRYWRILSKEMT